MKVYFIWISLLFVTLTGSAQTYYYDVTKTFNEDGYCYQCDVLKGAKFVTLYNKENKFTHVDQINKATGEQTSIAESRKRMLEDDSWTKPKCFSIVNNAFSTIEKQRVKDKSFTVVLYINPDTGKISDVEFRFLSISPYATIPVNVYRKIEVDLKENIWFIPTIEGKKRNYIMLFWRHEVK